MTAGGKADTVKSEEASSDACPECGADLSQRDRRAHSIKHYGEEPVDARKFPDAAKRQDQILGKGR